MAKHFLPHDTVNTIGTDDNISNVCSAIFALNGGGFVVVVNPRNSFVHPDTTFIPDVIVQRRQEEMSITELDRIAETCAQSEGSPHRMTCTNVCD